MITENYHPTSRKKFLGNLAVLSAGALFASTGNLFAADSNPSIDLKNEWKRFCKVNGGHAFNGNVKLSDEELYQNCSGHNYTSGEVIYFANKEVYAKPYWISLHGDKKPFYTVITFFTNDANAKMQFKIDGYELLALNRLNAKDQQLNSLGLIMQSKTAKEEELISQLNLQTEIKSNQAFSCKVKTHDNVSIIFNHLSV